jgi:aspartyl-tRNA(Asn)/glutamyl-tRNA(Gln) amidotransferase subunit A
LIENAFLSATKLAEQFGDGSLSPVEWLEATVERDNIVQSRLNPFRMIDPEQAREIARASERRWAEGNPLSPLDGVPVAIKDNQAIAGEPRTAASRTRASTADAGVYRVLQRVRSAIDALCAHRALRRR